MPNVTPDDLVNRVLFSLVKEGYTISKSTVIEGNLCISKDGEDYEINPKTFHINEWSRIRWSKLIEKEKGLK